MSRFKNLQKKLGYLKAFAFYSKIKKGNFSGLKTPNVDHPFTLRNNPFDYATFEEVLLNEAYNIDISFTPGHIIDGGGNIGLTACFFASKYPGAKIITIEPDSDNFKLLELNCKPYANIHALNCGIWKNDAFLKIENSNAGNNAFTVTETTDQTGDVIKAISISHVMEKFQISQIDILKLDIEGSEKEVFNEGFDKWLPKTKVLIIELHDDMKKGCSHSVFSAVNKYDFSFHIKGENVIFVNNNL